MLFILRTLIVLILSVCSCALYISPSFLFVDEDWPLLNPLPVTICPASPNLRIISGDLHNTLQITNINDTCATIKLRKHLDADIENVDGTRWQSFSLVLGTDEERESLEIQVVDVNDNTPIFQSLPTTFNISEKSPIGTVIGTVKVFDPDTGIGGVSKFFIEDDHFNVDRSKCVKFYCTSVISLAKMLDFEEKSVYNIVVVAQDGAGRTRKSNEARLPLKINVIDEQDMAPIFLDPAVGEIVISEGITPNTQIYRVKAVDGDQYAHPKHAIKYSISANEYLKIDSISGWITIKKSPDHELLPKFKIIVTATEDSEDGMWTEKEYLVLVEDHDDERPTCEKGSYQFEIEEGSLKFVRSARIYVYDKDQGGNAAFTALIEGEYSELFEIAPAYIMGSANLSLLLKEHTLDHERTESINLMLSLVPENSAETGNCSITIEVIDLNDNSPEFLNHSSEIFVRENSPATVLGSFQAVDKDSNKFLPIIYRLIGDDSKSFSIDKNGLLSSREIFDREKVDAYHIVIEAIDDFGHGNKAHFNLTVTITDENDNAPEFISNDYNISVTEGIESELIVEARDKDSGVNGEVKYFLINNTCAEISIDENSGKIRFEKIDAEKIADLEFSIIVRAMDSGKEHLYSDVNVNVKIHDINDNLPTFINSFISVTVDRHFVGTITKVEAFDLDRTSANNEITYEFKDAVKDLQINKKSGNIDLLHFPTNKSEFLNVDVVAKDNGIPRLKSIAKVFIRFKGKEEVAFEQPFVRIDIWENVTVGSVIYDPKISNTKPYLRYRADGDMNITWTKEQGLVRDFLKVNANTGGIYIANEIDGDLIDAIDLIISVEDNHDTILDRAYIKVVVNDINDNYPVFKETYYTTMVHENSPIGQELIKIEASDNDKTDKLRYSLVSLSGTDELVVVDDEGSVKIAKNIDYELINELNFTVLAQDLTGNVAAANFTIFVIDDNDNTPEFSPSSVFEISIEENTSTGSILNLSYPLAHDPDSGKYGHITYILLSENEMFEINSSTSEISLKAELDFEKQKVHSLTIKAVDNANGKGISNEAFASVNVQVIDVNDNAPKFIPSGTTVLKIFANEPIGSVITKIVATDGDSGMNGKISLKLKKTSDFLDLSKDGVLKIKSSLKRKAGKKMCIDIIASDMGAPPLSSEVKVCLLVTPENAQYGAPVIIWPEDNSIHNFDENRKYDQLLTLSVMLNSTIKKPNFRFMEVPNKDWKFFEIDAAGTIKARIIFDYEERKLYELKVEVCSQFCTFLSVFIAINDLNDNCPEFSEKENIFSVMENQVVGANGLFLGTFKRASDADGTSKYRNICYELQKSAEFFLENIHSNHIFLAQSLDREHAANYQLKITAYDCDHSCKDPRRHIKDQTDIVINVLDANDNFPKFTRRVYHGSVIQGRAKPSEKILTVYATDPDIEENGLHYRIKDFLKVDDKIIMPDESPFKINSKTGEIYSSTYFRMHKSSSFSFHVIVQDSVGHEDEALVTISTIGYDQQLELIFENISIHDNEKLKDDVQKLLSKATNLTAIIDGIVPSLNISVAMIHFLDEDNTFVPSERALSALDVSEDNAQKQARSVLQRDYGLRRADHVEVSRPFGSVTEKIALYVYGIIAVILLILLIVIIVYWRQKSAYTRKLRAVTAANVIRTTKTSLPGTNLHAKEPNPLWKQLRVSELDLQSTKKSDLQSTEL